MEQEGGSPGERKLAKGSVGTPRFESPLLHGARCCKAFLNQKSWLLLGAAFNEGSPFVALHMFLAVPPSAARLGWATGNQTASPEIIPMRL